MLHILSITSLPWCWCIPFHPLPNIDYTAEEKIGILENFIYFKRKYCNIILAKSEQATKSSQKLSIALLFFQWCFTFVCFLSQIIFLPSNQIQETTHPNLQSVQLKHFLTILNTNKIPEVGEILNIFNIQCECCITREGYETVINMYIKKSVFDFQFIW